MRTGVGVVAVLGMLGLAMPAGAQTVASSFFTGANPRDIKFTPIDVGAASKAYNLSNSFHAPTAPSALNLSRFLPSFSSPSWPPKIASPQVLQGTNPFQPTRPVGVN